MTIFSFLNRDPIIFVMLQFIDINIFNKKEKTEVIY